MLAATPSLAAELGIRGFQNVKAWPTGVEAELFRPHWKTALNLPRPIFLTVGRLAVEKNLNAFLALDLPGSEVVVGDGPARANLMRQIPQAPYLGGRYSAALAEIYAAVDVFVFPSRTDTFGLVLLEALASGLPGRLFRLPPRAMLSAKRQSAYSTTTFRKPASRRLIVRARPAATLRCGRERAGERA